MMFLYLNFKRIFTRKRGWTSILPYMRRVYEGLFSFKGIESTIPRISLKWFRVGHIISVTPFKIDQNKNKNCSIHKVQNLLNEWR